MTTSEYSCSKCGSVLDFERDVRRIENDIRGEINEEIFDNDRLSAEAEHKVIELDFGYHYFEEDVLHLIKRGTLAGKIRNFCAKCLWKTLPTEDPHYGDGVYLTFHENLLEASPQVKSAHGVIVAQRTHRVKIIVRMDSDFMKVPRTGGVYKSKMSALYTTESKVFLRDMIDVDFIGFEVHKDGKWTAMEERG